MRFLTIALIICAGCTQTEEPSTSSTTEAICTAADCPDGDPNVPHSVPPGDVPATSDPLNDYGVRDRAYCLEGGGQTVCCGTFHDQTHAGACCRRTSWSLSCYVTPNIYGELHLPF